MQQYGRVRSSTTYRKSMAKASYFLLDASADHTIASVEY
jgi:hypothetical protein